MADDDWLSPRARAAESAAGGGFDLTECVREPIHLLGRVQSFGVLLAVGLHDGIVRVASDNVHDRLGLTAGQLLGRPAHDVLGHDVLGHDVLEAALRETVRSGENSALLPEPLRTASGALFDVTAHRRDALLVLELEPCQDLSRARPGLHRRVQQALLRIQRCTTVADCCAAAVREVRLLTGYQRVVAYRFEDEDGPGEVVAEDAAAHLEPWLGLWFPASDIPPQARRLYQRNWIRVIGDVDDPGAGLDPPLRPSTGRPLDLSSAALRTVSSFHLEYLRNIGVRSSMSVSVLRDDTLWGLIACHGEEPVWLSPDVRSACELFGSALSVQLATIDDREQATALEHRRAALERLLADLSDSPAASLHDHADALGALVDADGTIVVHDGATTVRGPAVAGSVVERLRSLAADLRPGEVWATDRLPEILAPHADGTTDGTADAPEPAGVLLLPLGDGLLAWYRTERPTSRCWASDPALPVRLGPHGERLTPRGSSAVFRATVRGRSLPWTAADRAGAGEATRAVADLLARHSAWTADFNRRLQRSNADLDAFAHAAAHELKEPLRGISNAAIFIVEDAAASLDEVSLRRLDTVRRLAARMDSLLDSLLRYSQVSAVGLDRIRIPLATALDAALDIAGERLAEHGVSVVRGVLPVVSADPDRLQDVLVNLLVNAAKYAREDGPRFVCVDVERRDDEHGTAQDVVVVRDNGIGIPPEHQDEVFGLFRRLHRPTEKGGGSGAGLAIVRRIVERHGGSVWLRTPPAGGTEVCFTLPDD
ncbi:Bacteriophytochrome (light-regulated signal transduction histidine kinase) [Streptomyces sp. TLI_053]|uniref:ATP-binding protein n=1 Tax=Streptomyces sp. TLI_053 TaxID=1855352 RepID=UPI0008799C06|nr:ATP-binding protein [Streptomyces sp. TLI_053]SDS61827.1 Bacteriophytochrome (light-regulated signal transduction histidine kinase) [Streptomyces sp. TLI_053]